ncbi:MAG: PQQ-binding-like beta-propeller repeat protein [Vicinamibacteraceae bacterium]
MTNGRAAAGLGLLLGLAAAAPAAAQWGQFRGPNGSGVEAATGYPVAFSPTSQMVWKAAVPFAQSSPVVAGSRLYLTASEGDQLLTIAFDAAGGRELWRRPIRRPRATEIYKANDPASPTPAADAQGVVVFFADVGLVAYAPDGTERWRAPLGPFQNFYGMAGSPIIAGDAVILVCDQMSGSFMVAVDRKTGRERWRRARPGITVSWTTPMVFDPGGGADRQLVVLSSTRLDGYTLATGEPRWWMPLSSQGAIGTAVSHRDTVIVATLAGNEPWMEPFATALQTFDTDKDGKLSRPEWATEKGMGEHFGWVDADGSGSVDAAEYDDARAMGIGEYGVAALKPAGLTGKVDPSVVLWRFKKNLPFVPTPVVYDGLIYMVKAGGIVTALDPATGQAVKEGRSKDAPGDYTASPIAADGKVFLASVNGKVTVLKAGREWEVLGVNDLGDEIHATPALAGGRLYVRTRGTLYCFGAKG